LATWLDAKDNTGYVMISSHNECHFAMKRDFQHTQNDNDRCYADYPEPYLQNPDGDGNLNNVRTRTDNPLERRHDAFDVGPHQTDRRRHLYSTYGNIKARLENDADQGRAYHCECSRGKILVPRC
jgi:hypothetical protein